MINSYIFSRDCLFTKNECSFNGEGEVFMANKELRAKLFYIQSLGVDDDT